MVFRDLAGHVSTALCHGARRGASRTVAAGPREEPTLWSISRRRDIDSFDIEIWNQKQDDMIG